MTKVVVDQIDRGIPALLRMPELYVWVVVAIAATAWEQSAFRAGPLTASLPAVTISEPIVGSVLGIAVLGETLDTNTVGWVAVGVSVAVMAAATVALAHSEGSYVRRKKSEPFRVSVVEERNMQQEDLTVVRHRSGEPVHAAAGFSASRGLAAGCGGHPDGRRRRGDHLALVRRPDAKDRDGAGGARRRARPHGRPHAAQPPRVPSGGHRRHAPRRNPVLDLQHLGADQIRYLFSNAENKIVITEKDFLPAVKAAETDLSHVIVVDANIEGCITLKHLETLGAGEGFDFDSAWQAVRPDDVATLIYTSEPPGRPRVSS